MSRKDDDRLVTVCDKCKCASCWHGEFMCDDAKGAGIVDLPVSTLREMALEHPRYWEADRDWEVGDG